MVMRIINGKIYAVCYGCGKIIRVNKPLIGSVHFCTTEEEKNEYPNVIKYRALMSEKELEDAK
jgi:hypothetical protein